MRVLLNIEKWNRKDHFNFFSKFEEPFFGVTVEVDCTNAYQFAKKNSQSFFLKYLHCSLIAANRIESFHYRIEDEKIWIYDKVNASPTINRPDGTFGFAYLDYFEDFKEFSIQAKTEIERVQASTGLAPAGSGDNVIHYSSLPWLKFTAVSHARSFSYKDSCPKISFGSVFDQSNKKLMPVSIHVNHALMDGYQVGLFVDEFQKLLNDTF